MFIATFGEKYGLFSCSTFAFIFINLRNGICTVETIFGAIHSRIIAFLHYAERCCPIAILIIKAGITFFASVCRLLLSTTLPAFIAHSRLVHIIVITLSLFSLIFAVHVNNRG